MCTWFLVHYSTHLLKENIHTFGEGTNVGRVDGGHFLIDLVLHSPFCSSGGELPSPSHGATLIIMYHFSESSYLRCPFKHWPDLYEFFLTNCMCPQDKWKLATLNGVSFHLLCPRPPPSEDIKNTENQNMISKSKKNWKIRWRRHPPLL